MNTLRLSGLARVFVSLRGSNFFVCEHPQILDEKELHACGHSEEFISSFP